jgi:acetylornithine/N-succinyldiaminopimelate aminotransferase
VRNAAERGRRLREAIAALDSPLIDGCRGQGLLIGIALRHPVAKAVVAAAQEHGLIINAPNDETIRLVPALNIGDVEIDEFLSLFRASLGTVEDALVLDGQSDGAGA